MPLRHCSRGNPQANELHRKRHLAACRPPRAGGRTRVSTSAARHQLRKSRRWRHRPPRFRATNADPIVRIFPSRAARPAKSSSTAIAPAPSVKTANMSPPPCWKGLARAQTPFARHDAFGLSRAAAPGLAPSPPPAPELPPHTRLLAQFAGRSASARHGRLSQGPAATHHLCAGARRPTGWASRGSNSRS